MRNLLLILFCFGLLGLKADRSSIESADPLANWGGHVDAVTFDSDRNAYYIFNGDEYTRHNWNQDHGSGYPRKIQGNWSGWPSSWGTGNVDAVTYDSKRKVFYLFKGDEYVRHEYGKPCPSGYPRKIAGNWKGWPSSWGAGYVEAVTYDSKRDVYYLFKVGEYAKHSWGQDINSGYPRAIVGNWSGWPSSWGRGNASAATYDSQRDVYYLFHPNGNQYTKHTWGGQSTSPYPRSTPGYWKGYPVTATTNPFVLAFASDTQLGYCNSSNCKERPRTAIRANEWHSTSIGRLKSVVPDRGHLWKGVVINGDMTNTNSPEEFEDYLRLYQNRYTVYPGFGNHEWQYNDKTCWAGPTPVKGYCSQRVYDNYFTQVKKVPGLADFDIREKNLNSSSIGVTTIGTEYTGSWGYSWDIGDYHFIQLNYHPSFSQSLQINYAVSAGYGSTLFTYNYSVSKALDWLEKDLQANASKKTIINMHAMVEDGVRSTDGFSESSYQGDYARFQRALHQNVMAIFVGHYHNLVGQRAYYEAGYPKNPADVAYWDWSIPATNNGNRKVPIFYCGSAETSKYLEVTFHSNRLRIAVIDSNGGSLNYTGEYFTVETN